MLSCTDWDDGSGDEEFTETLSQLKQQGASVLVVGSVRASHRRDICRRLLGGTPAQPRRRILVSTTGETHDIAHLLGREAGTTPSETLTLINYRTQARNGTSELTSNETDHATPPAESSTDVSDLAELGIAISSAIERYETRGNGLDPAELRVGIDSLVPLLDAYTTERVFKFVHLTNGRTRDTDGMIHYHLPMDRDSDVVSVLSPLFDIVIELREHDDGFQERWTITDGNHSSGWIAVER